MSVYFLLSALPPLGELGTAPPLAATALRDLLESQDRDAVDAVLLGDDLAQHLAFISGEPIEPSPAVLSLAQVRGQLRLPEPLGDDDDANLGGDPADRLYGRYFAHVIETGTRTGVPLLGRWAEYEVMLRRALALVRAQRLGHALDSKDLAADVEVDLEGNLDADGADAAPEVRAWLDAEDPLDGERRLERARWSWLAERDHWFGFSRTELVAYALRLLLLERWHAREDPTPAASREARATTPEGHEP